MAKVLPEVGPSAATISLAIALAPHLFLNGCADACAASILAILRTIALAQFKYRSRIIIVFQQLWLKFRKNIDEEDL